MAARVDRGRRRRRGDDDSMRRGEFEDADAPPRCFSRSKMTSTRWRSRPRDCAAAEARVARTAPRGGFVEVDARVRRARSPRSRAPRSARSRASSSTRLTTIPTRRRTFRPRRTNSAAFARQSTAGARSVSSFEATNRLVRGRGALSRGTRERAAALGGRARISVVPARGKCALRINAAPLVDTLSPRKCCEEYSSMSEQSGRGVWEGESRDLSRERRRGVISVSAASACRHTFSARRRPGRSTRGCPGNPIPRTRASSARRRMARTTSRTTTASSRRGRPGRGTA